MKCALLKLCTTNVLTVNRSSPTQIKTQLQSNITEGGNCDICNSKLTETIVHLCCRIILFYDPHKASLFKFPFNFKSPVHPLICSLLSMIILFHNLHHPIHLKRNKWVNAIKLRTPKHSFSVCSVQILQCDNSAVGCCQCLQTPALYSADWFISSVSPPPRSRTPHAACVRAGPGLRTPRAAQFQSSLRERGMWFALGQSYHQT